MTTSKPVDVLKIRALNDKLRQTRIGGRVVLSIEVANLDEVAISEILALIATFSEFTSENDPYGEHDCAVVNWGGHRVLFKIDYYDPRLQHHSDDPADSNATTRVMTVMFTSEY